jgi:hypothetical protein
MTAEIVKTLIDLQVKRKFAIKLANKLVSSTRALARRYSGFLWDASEEAREKINARAARLVAKALADEAPDAEDEAIVETMSAELTLLAICLKPLTMRRQNVEGEMCKLVRQLAVYPWTKNVKGLGEIGLAVIVGEAGDLGKYPNVRHLWRRLGLAPYEGRAMSNWHGNELSSEEWIECGYSRRRRAEIFSCVEESLAKWQLGSAKKAGTDFSVAKGPYGELYVRRRTHCLKTHPDWSRGHLHADAMRIMVKQVIKDLWREWCRVEGIKVKPSQWAEAAE